MEPAADFLAQILTDAPQPVWVLNNQGLIVFANPAAVAALAVGVQGLQLAGAPIWLPDLFDGVALLLAVGFAQVQRSPATRTAAIRRVLRLRGGAAQSGAGA